MAKPKIITPQELDKVLANVEKNKYPERDKALILISYYTGLTVSQISKISMGDVFNENWTLRDSIIIKDNKNQFREMPIHSKLIPALTNFISTRLARDKDFPLFHGNRRLGFTANNLCQWFHYTYRQAGIKGASSNSGRKTFCSNLIAKGVKIKIVSNLAGYSNDSGIQRFLSNSQPNPGLMRNVVELV